MTAFVEYRPTPRTAINFGCRQSARARTPLATGSCSRPTELLPTSVFDEFRDRNRHQAFQITLKQSFGGGGGTRVASKGK